MIRLDGAITQRVHALIERYGLHDDDAIIPVPILQVAKNEGWKVYYHSQMGGAIAIAVVDGPIKLMYVNANLTHQAQREGIAHEMAHVLAGHGASLDMYMANGHKHLGIKRQTDWQEQEAVVISTMLLIPEAVRDSPFSDREVADMCQVGLRCARYARSFVPMDGLRLVAS